MLQKIEHYKSALAQLNKAVDAWNAAPTDALYRDGLIQRFEFTFELAWKSLKEYLEDQGLMMTGSSTVTFCSGTPFWSGPWRFLPWVFVWTRNP